ncbi:MULTISPECIES: four helix bundle protein [unclassified Thiocapsa]|uniref:four helix bundle protein n=2 Tax=unclassified Thiocapsa TaxID=2641286 RepID=UPI0035B35369
MESGWRLMTSINSYRDLIVWKKSMDLAVMIYAETRQLPAEERYGISSQMRRAASSVAANIAEGQARRTTGEFLQSLGMARGSLAELETFIELCARLEYIALANSEALLSVCAEINKMLAALMRSLATRH